MSGRFSYNNINFDFDRNWNDFQVTKTNNQIETESIAGIIETLEVYNKDTITLSRNFLSGGEIEQLDRWWNYVRDGSSFSLYRDVNFGLLLPFEGKSLESTEAIDGTFTRGSGCYTLNPDTGLLELIVSGTTERYESGKFGRGILIESAMTNYITNADFTNIAWTKSNVTASVVTTEILSPTGSTSVYKLAPTGTPAALYFTTVQTVGTDNGTFSVYLRVLSGTKTVTLKLRRKNGAAADLATQAVTVTTEWQKFQVNYATTGNYSGEVWQAYFEWASGDLYADFPQIETKEHASSYYATTRDPENLYYDVSDIFTQSQRTWSIAFWIKPEWDFDGHTEGSKYLLWITRSGTSNRCVSIVNLSNGNWEVRAYTAANTANEIAGSASGHLTKDTWSHICVTNDSAQANNFKLYVNGALVTTDTNSAFVPAEGDRMYVGCGTGTGSEADAHFDDVFIYKSALSAAQVKSVYSAQGLSHRRNYWSAVKIANPSFNPVERVGNDRYDFSVDLIEVLS